MNDFFSVEPSDGSHSIESEGRIIKAILKEAGALDRYKELAREYRAETDTKEPNLAWFAGKYTSFPVWLGTRKVEWQRDVFGSLIKRFTLTPCYKAWEEVNDSKPDYDERSVGCVFTWPAFGVCCIHQYAPSYISNSDGILISRKLPSFDERFIIEPLTQLLKNIGWKMP